MSTLDCPRCRHVTYGPPDSKRQPARTCTCETVCSAWNCRFNTPRDDD